MNHLPPNPAPLTATAAKLRILSDRFSARVNALPLFTQRLLFLIIGLTIAILCTTILYQAIVPPAKVNPITTAPQPDSPIPFGQFKGLHGGTFYSLTLAIDKQGHLYIRKEFPTPGNHPAWEPITGEQLKLYHQSLPFTPLHDNNQNK